jgi:4-hydroxy-tetrahydrodipicolinate reductase
MGTGFVGHLAIRAVLDHPQLELAGVWVHDPDKVGRDAGELARDARRTGILATNDFEQLLSLRADCLLSAAAGNGRDDFVVHCHARFLEAGTNVLSSSLAGLNHPASYYRQDLVELLRCASAAGNSSFLGTGLDPGYSSDLAINLTQASHYWSSIHIQENYDYSTYLPTQTEEILRFGLGFGQPMDFDAHLFQPRTLQAIWGGPSVQLVADALGVKIDGFREQSWRHASDSTYEVPGFGVIERGTQEAFRFEIQGLIEGRPAIVHEHVTRMRKGCAPQWSSGDYGEGYYIKIEGDPQISAHFGFTGPDGDHQYGAINATAMKMVNAIPGLCEARPGVLTAPVDMPAMMGRGIYRPAV